MIALAQALYVVSLLGMTGLCAYILRARASRMRGLWYALGMWFAVPAIAILAQLAAPTRGALPPFLLATGVFMVGSSMFAWIYVTRRVRAGKIAVPDVEAVLAVERRARRERTVMLAEIVLARCDEWEAEEHGATG